MSGAPVGIRVDLINPGQYFACCGLLELADRHWDGAQGWFNGDHFLFRPSSLGRANDGPSLLREVAAARLDALEPGNAGASPLHLAPPFDLRLDWWTDVRSGGKQLKVWAGSMRVSRIAVAMQTALLGLKGPFESLLDVGMVVADPDKPKDKVEPFYFDARRGASALAQDLGFSPDALSMRSEAHPAVEFLCLIGLQRFRPAPTSERNVFEYTAWTMPLDPRVASLATAHVLRTPQDRTFRFKNAFRTDQRKHKAFTPATAFSRS